MLNLHQTSFTGGEQSVLSSIFYKRLSIKKPQIGWEKLLMIGIANRTSSFSVNRCIANLAFSSPDSK